MNPDGGWKAVPSFSKEERAADSLDALDKAVRMAGIPAAHFESDSRDRGLLVPFEEVLTASQTSGDLLVRQDRGIEEVGTESRVFFLSSPKVGDLAAVCAALPEEMRDRPFELVGIPEAREREPSVEKTRACEAESGLTYVCDVVVGGRGGGRVSAFRVCQIAEREGTPDRIHFLRPGPTRIEEGPGYLTGREKYFKDRRGY